MVLEGNGKKLVWEFKFKMRKMTKARRPNLILENELEKKIWVIEKIVEETRYENCHKYQQLLFEMRERRRGDI